MGKTKAEIAEEVRNEYLTTATVTSDEELKEWNRVVYADLKAAENAMFAARSKAQNLETIRKDARSAHRHSLNTANTAAAWRTSVAAAEAAREDLRQVRDTRNRLQALSELLSQQLQQRKAITVVEQEEEETAAAEENHKKKPPPKSRAIEACPFCEHTYTVRDGKLLGTDAQGNRLQLRKCQCREMAPPCRNCPTCKANATVMGAQGQEQLRLCREELRCEICSCECPGAGKWVESDEDSRLRYRERAKKRYAELSALLQRNWSGGGGGGGDLAGPSGSLTGGNGGGGGSSTGVLASALRRLPADIKDQLEAAAAAESLQFSFAFEKSVGCGGGAPSASAATQSLGVCGGRTCCGETLATVKRRRLDNNNSASNVDAEVDEECTADNCDNQSHHHHHHHHHRHEHRKQQQQQPEQLEQEEDEEEQQHHSDDDDDHHHHHRCEHPHDECTSDCCSVASHTDHHT